VSQRPPSLCVSKAKSWQTACRHDVERFLRSSTVYSYAWLRRERLFWHPDRFAQRCDPDFRKELTQKATEMYQIYEELIEQEVAAGRASSREPTPTPEASSGPSHHRSSAGGAGAKKKDLGRTATAIRAFSGTNLRFTLGDVITNIVSSLLKSSVRMKSWLFADTMAPTRRLQKRNSGAAPLTAKRAYSPQLSSSLTNRICRLDKELDRRRHVDRPQCCLPFSESRREALRRAP